MKEGGRQGERERGREGGRRERGRAREKGREEDFAMISNKPENEDHYSNGRRLGVRFRQ